MVASNALLSIIKVADIDYHGSADDYSVSAESLRFVYQANYHEPWIAINFDFATAYEVQDQLHYLLGSSNFYFLASVVVQVEAYWLSDAKHRIDFWLLGTVS